MFTVPSVASIINKIHDVMVLKTRYAKMHRTEVLLPVIYLESLSSRKNRQETQ